MDPKKVLVVDDSEFVHKMHAVVLQKYRGCEILHAYNGVDALQQLHKHPDVELILLDVNMPVMDGLSFLRARRESGLFANVPVIVISTEGSEDVARRGLEAGADAYLTKPFRAAELHGVIDGLGARLETP
jgi:chemotaxis family two-component system sensor histidine kinase/response regulator PixL